MKEKLILFTRDERNKDKVMCIHIAILMLCFICNSINPNVYLITIVVVEILLKEAILALFKKSDDQLRKNKISIIFFSDFEAMMTALLIPLVILAAKLSFSINLFLGIVLAIIIIAIDIFIALKISNYFAKRLK